MGDFGRVCQQIEGEGEAIFSLPPAKPSSFQGCGYPTRGSSAVGKDHFHGHGCPSRSCLSAVGEEGLLLLWFTFPYLQFSGTATIKLSSVKSLHLTSALGEALAYTLSTEGSFLP
jgi:hypothetical protein